MLTAAERITRALGYEEPDRVPFFLPLTMHGAKELNLSIKDYFTVPENVVEGQLKMLAKYGHDFLFTFFYAAVDLEAWGGRTIFYEDGPPNSGEPIIKKRSDIEKLEVPRIGSCPGLEKVLRATSGLKEKVGADVPIVGVVMSPFSLPVMQMGFSAYIELLYEEPELFNLLMDKNIEFCIGWANAQLSAGASLIGYFDPVASPSITPAEISKNSGFEIAKKTLAAMDGPTVTLFASGRCLSVVDDIVNTGTSGIGVGSNEDIGEVKKACAGRMSVLGNLNGIEMRRWTPGQAEMIVKEKIAQAGQGGGFILSDQHGEVPFQVPEAVLMAISDAVKRWGRYPLTWTKQHAA